MVCDLGESDLCTITMGLNDGYGDDSEITQTGHGIDKYTRIDIWVVAGYGIYIILGFINATVCRIY